MIGCSLVTGRPTSAAAGSSYRALIAVARRRAALRRAPTVKWGLRRPSRAAASIWAGRATARRGRRAARRERAAPARAPRPSSAAAADDPPGRGRRIRSRGSRDRPRPRPSGGEGPRCSTRPSRMATVLSTRSLTSASWVATTMVTPSSRLRRRNRSNTSCAVAESSSPVGSSARITSGPVGQGDRDRDPLLLAAGHGVRSVVGPIGDADLVE